MLKLVELLIQFRCDNRLRLLLMTYLFNLMFWIAPFVSVRPIVPFALKIERFCHFLNVFNRILRSGLGRMFASRPTCFTFRRNGNLVHPDTFWNWTWPCLCRPEQPPLPPSQCWSNLALTNGPSVKWSSVPTTTRWSLRAPIRAKLSSHPSTQRIRASCECLSPTWNSIKVSSTFGSNSIRTRVGPLISSSRNRREMRPSTEFRLKIAIIFCRRRYTDERHTDFVRDATWSPAHVLTGCSDRLYSCGWDQQVLMRDLSNLSRK